LIPSFFSNGVPEYPAMPGGYPQMSIGRSGTSQSVTTLGAALYSEGTAPMKRLYVVAFALVLAGCGGDPPPAAPSTPSPSASGTSLAAPVMPEGAKEDSSDGAVAFFKHYVDLINFAQETGDTTALAVAEGPKCASCQTGRQSIEDIYNNGGHLLGGRIRFKLEVARFSSLRHRWTINVRLIFDRQSIVQSQPTPSTQTRKPGSFAASFMIDRVHGRWVVGEWVRRV